MTENWSAVSKAINRRLAELGLKQRELVDRSHVSQAIVREIQNHTVERRRSDRTLEALSLALEWHPRHLDAVLHGRKPLEPGQTGDALDDISARLAAIEDHLREITERLDTVSTSLATLLNASGRRGTR